MEAAKHGAKGLVLHYFGDEVTTEEVKSLQAEISEKYGSESIAVPGDIAEQDTSTKVRGHIYRNIIAN